MVLNINATQLSQLFFRQQFEGLLLKLLATGFDRLLNLPTNGRTLFLTVRRPKFILELFKHRPSCRGVPPQLVDLVNDVGRDTDFL